MKRHCEGATPSAPKPALSELVDASANCVWILNLGGEIACMNPAAQRLFNSQGSDIWANGWPEESRLTMERARATARGGRRAKFRFQHSDADGAVQYFDITVSPMRDADGEISQLFAVAVDVTRQTESDAFLSSVVEALPQALTVRDLRSKRIVLSNRSADDLAAMLQADDKAGVADFEWSTDSEATVASVHRHPLIDVVETLAGPRRYSTRKIVTYDDQGARHLITLSEDVTTAYAEREATLQALHDAKAAEEAKSAFLANMNHEIRTPLNGVIAGLDALQARLGDGHRELLGIVRDSATALGARIDELFAAGQATVDCDLQSERIALPSLLEELIQPYVETARAKNIALIVADSPHVPADFTGDRRCLVSALGPLIHNAVKFTDFGQVTVRVDQFDDAWLRISVLDTGVGFDPAAKDQLFAPFGRLDQSLTRRFGGLGLGLASARNFAARMGGSIDAAPRVEGGSIFWVDIPLHPMAGASPIEALADEPPHERLRILVADDHPTNRRVVELILGDVADVTAVADGQLAVEAARTTAFDVILMDIQMPVMDGITAVAAIREHERNHRVEPAPIIMLTANTHDEYVRASHNAGANRHIAKPFTAAVLLEAVQRSRPAQGLASCPAEPVRSGIRASQTGGRPTPDNP